MKVFNLVIVLKNKSNKMKGGPKVSLDTKVGQIKPEEFKSQMQEPVAANKVTSLKVRGARCPQTPC